MSSNYDLTFVTGTLTIDRAKVEITSIDPNAVRTEPKAASAPVDNFTIKLDPSIAWSQVKIDVTLTPVAGGGSITRSGLVPVSGVFDLGSIPLGCYDIAVTVNAPNYYSDPYYDAFSVYDPTLGFATGGGWFYWPDETQDKTTFGFVTNYGKKGANFKGSLILVRHTEDGIYRIKSNALSGLSITSGSGYGTVSFSGKATYTDLSLETTGNYSFAMYAEDWNEPGSGNDFFWVRVKNGTVSADGLYISETAKDNLQQVVHGNIAIPHNAR